MPLEATSYPCCSPWNRPAGAPFRELAMYAVADDGLAALTLTTFADVPRNGPYYERLDFRHLCETELTPGL